MTAPSAADAAPLTIHKGVVTGQAGSHLRAWDAADRALLQAVDATCQRVVIIGERWGALAVPLAGRLHSVEIDSAAGRAALASNWQRLVDDAELPTIQPFVDMAGGAQGAGADGVVLRAAQSVALFAWQLRSVHSLAAAGTPVWIGAAPGVWSRGHQGALAAWLGADSESAAAGLRGTGKARVGRFPLPPHASPPAGEAGGHDAAANASAGAWRRISGPTGFDLLSLPGVFSHGRIDPGARAMLAAMPARCDGQVVVDLGCGNGVLGVEAARRGAAALLFTDDSARALAAARATWRAAMGDPQGATPAPAAPPSARFHHADAGAGLPAGQADLVLCNPPFHQGRAQTLHIVDAMLLASRRLLRRGGALLMVGNRHLRHDQRAKGVLGGVKVVHDDGRFTVLRGRR